MELWRLEAGEELLEFTADPEIAPSDPKHLEIAKEWLAQTVPKELPIAAWSAILHAGA